MLVTSTRLPDSVYRRFGFQFSTPTELVFSHESQTKQGGSGAEPLKKKRGFGGESAANAAIGVEPTTIGFFNGRRKSLFYDIGKEYASYMLMYSWLYRKLGSYIGCHT